MIEIEPVITLGQILSISVPLIGTGLGVYGAYLVFRTKMKRDVAHLDSRVMQLAAGALELQKEVRDNKVEADRMYVRHDDLAKVQVQVQHSIGVLSDDVRLAIATMGDVRDTVLRLESRLYPDETPKLPPARRRVTKGNS